jgi:tryptophan-rich sensory protein
VLGLHTGQLALNAAWPAAFFAARNRRLSLAVVAALDGAIATEITTAARRDPVAAGLLTPYLAWSLFATALTAVVSDPATASPRGTLRRRRRHPRRT